MELLTLPQLADAAAIPLSTARYYRDRFILFVPSVRVGRTVLHPEEAVEVLTLIKKLASSGAGVAEIENALEKALPVTVVTSQPVSSDVSITGSATVIGELAHMLDDRGARVEQEVTNLRDRVSRSATASQLEGVVFETRLTAHVIGERIGSEMEQVKANVDELRAQVSQLASRDQLEWIGDVVSAAISRAPGSGQSGSLEMKLLEIQEELHRPRPSDDVAELRVAVDRLAEHVSSRDKEFQRTLHALVNVMRSEIKTLQSELQTAVGELRQVPAPEHRVDVVTTVVPQAPSPEGTFPVEAVEVAEEYVPEPGKSRSPRRLGHVVRTQEPLAAEIRQPADSEDVM